MVTRANETTVFMQVDAGAAHPRRMLEALADYAHGQTPPWGLRWGSVLPLEDLRKLTYQGLVFFHLPPTLLGEIQALGIPAVQVGSEEPEGSFPSVLPDHRVIGGLAVEHFRERLFRSFAFMGDPSRLFSRERLRGFREALTPDMVFQSFDFVLNEPMTYVKLRAWLGALPVHTGIFAANDYLALQICNLCGELGLRIPGDRAVLGVDNDSMLMLTSPVPFSSIDTGSSEIGRRAGGILADLMAGKPLRRNSVLIPPVGVVPRASTDHLATDDEKVSAAARMIREEACSGLKVDEICRRVGLGRRMFEKRFQRELGRSPEAEMRQIRMERARFLLMTTNKSVQEIAEESGFQDSYYFSAAFKKANGLSPRNWRVKQSEKPERDAPSPWRVAINKRSPGWGK